ncbi:MAG: SDR family oxidoreductase [Pseudomonadota bacterium]
MSGRSVIITGAASGVGAACAKRFAEAGDHLILADADEDAGAAVAADLAEKGAKVAFVHADTAKRLDVHNIIAEALDANGRIDVLAHTVIRRHTSPFLETSEEDFDQVINANLRGAFLMSQAVAKQFVKQAEAETSSSGRGVIVNIGSVEAVTADADHVAFAASQGGLHQLTKAVAMALSPHGARVNTVGLGSIKGEMDESAKPKKVSAATPLKRIGDPEEAANVVFFLAGEDASYVTGQTIYVDGGRLAQFDSGSTKTDD